ncbi:MAG: hypothetical protein GW809_09265 [Bacteroidetes bacterium]|nr:hypothetical protein [Bacteroidota bacterium]
MKKITIFLSFLAFILPTWQVNAQIQIAPWLENVETHTPTTNSTITTNAWSSTPSGTTTAYRWNIDGAGSTPSGSTGPSGAFSGVNYFYTEASNGSAGDVAELISPQIDLTALTNPVLEFRYHMYGQTMGDFT